jgi:hypothetical protein
MARLSAVIRMSDLIDRLQEQAGHCYNGDRQTTTSCEVYEEAAEEIDRLQEQLRTADALLIDTWMMASPTYAHYDALEQRVWDYLDPP